MENQLEKNSTNILEARFENLLKGIDTEKYKYTSENQKQTTIRSIKSLVKERLSEKGLNQNSQIWKIIIDMDKLNFEDIIEIKRIYSKLYNLNDNQRSTYFKQVGREKK